MIMILRHSLVKIWNMVNSVISISPKASINSSPFSPSRPQLFCWGHWLQAPNLHTWGAHPTAQFRRQVLTCFPKSLFPGERNCLPDFFHQGCHLLGLDLPEELSVSSLQSLSIWPSLSHDSLRWPQEFHWGTLPWLHSSPSVDRPT